MKLFDKRNLYLGALAALGGGAGIGLAYAMQHFGSS